MLSADFVWLLTIMFMKVTNLAPSYFLCSSELKMKKKASAHAQIEVVHVGNVTRGISLFVRVCWLTVCPV